MDSLPSSAVAYIIVGFLTSLTTLAVAYLNKRYSRKIKPDHSTQTGYSDWVAYLEREINTLKNENKELNKRVTGLERKLYDKENLIVRMRVRLLELSRKYNEDVSALV